MRLLISVALLLALPLRTGTTQARGAAPPIRGFVLGELRGRSARNLRCEAIRDSIAATDSLYRAYGYSVCTRSATAQVWLYFVRDTLVKVSANQGILNPQGSVRMSPEGAIRSVQNVWTSLQLEARAIFGSAPDSVSAASVGRTPDEVGLTAYWRQGEARRWSGRYQVNGRFFDGSFVVGALVVIEDPCVTTVPWRTCSPATAMPPDIREARRAMARGCWS
jgi:hypothetical protein